MLLRKRVMRFHSDQRVWADKSMRGAWHIRATAGFFRPLSFAPDDR